MGGLLFVMEHVQQNGFHSNVQVIEYCNKFIIKCAANEEKERKDSSIREDLLWKSRDNLQRSFSRYLF